MNLLRLLITRAATAAALVLSLAPSPARAAVDVSPVDGIPDIWALRYSSGALLPTADTDGDGQKNSAEAAAGTNPRQSGSVIKITNVTADGTGVHLTFPTEEGKRYQVQTATTLVSATWVDLGTPLAPDGSGTLTKTNNAVGATGLFYRVRVQDIDSDGDGVSDWEEMQIGFDPFNSHSNGLSAAGDLAAITAALSAPNSVSVSSSGVPIAEPAAGNVSTDPGTFTITRTGNLNAITVNYAVSGSAVAGSDYVALSGSVTLGLGVNSATVTVSPLPDNVLESREAVILTVSASASYSVGSPAAAAVLINDYSQANGNGVTARFWNNTSATIPVFTNTSGATNGSATPVLTRIDPLIDNTWGATSPGAGVNVDYFVSRFSGDVLPEFSQIYTFQGQVERGGRLWVNGQLIFSSWGNTPTAGTYSGTIELTGGQRASLVFEHMARSGDATAILRWQSTNQALQVIPQSRLFSSAPPQILSNLAMLLIRGGPVATYQIVGTNDPTSYSAANLPAGWSINTTTGVLGINPTQTGTWQIPITATNALGSGSAILEIKVIATDALITRDVWTGVSGNLVSDILLTTAPTTTGTLTSLEGPQNSADNYGARIRGYITAPITGTYKFWLTSDEAAELWISDDEEPVNAFKRAALTAPVGYRNWAAGAATQLLYFEAGSRYYVEVRHKEGTGADHVSVGWLKPGDPGTTAFEVVPGYALSQYVAPTVIPGESTLYSTTMSAQGGAISSGYGTATLRVSADESVATLKFTFANLTTNLAASGRHIHAGNHGGLIVFDIDTATPNADGSFTWVIVPTGAVSKQDILDEIHGGTAYLNIHTATYPAGEIKGYFALQAASQTFTPPPAPPSWTDDHADANAASRFLTQSTFGATGAEIAAVQGGASYEAWIDSQFLISPTHHLDFVYLHRNQTSPNGPTYYSDLSTNAWWQNSTLGADELRQRIAFALNQILVVSTAGPLEDNARAVSSFYDTLLDKAFGNFRDILEAVTLTPGMGIYLDMRRNDKPNLTTGSHPNENYAREIKQLFSIGLNRLHPDGTLVLNSKGELIPTYGQDEIVGFAHVFTGWNYNQFDPATPPNPLPTNWSPASNYTAPMTEVPSHHYTGQKRILNRVMLAGLPTVLGQPLDPYATHSPAQINDPAYQALPAQELDATHDALFNHPNCPPFICRQLIQRLVTSTPSLGYVYRVVSKFENNGSGVRGDMKAVIKAILLDYEARSTAVLAQQGYGKQREPVLRVTAITRAFAPPAAVSGTYTQDGGVISVDTSPTPHRLVSGNPVSLIFTGAPQSTNGEYALSGTFPPTTTVMNMRTKDVIRSNYTQSGSVVTVATGNNGGSAHGLATGDSAFVRFRDGAGKPADGMFAVTVVDAGHFTVTVPTTATISTLANCDVAFLRGRYDQSGTTVTLTCETIHGLTTGNIAVTFTGAIGQGSTPAEGTYPFTVVDDTHLTITVPDSVGRVGYFVAGMDTPTLNRTGAASTAYSAWSVGNTETDIAQTPLRSPTVFNFYLPDYQYPGILANAGLVTPEFELTSETTVVRQANFLYNGIFNPTTSTGGISSFRSGAGDMAVDFSPWMGIKPGGATPWTNNENVNALIDQLNTLLMAGQLPSTGVNNYAANPRVIVNARQAIYDFVTNTSNIAYTAAAPTDTQKRDRIRAIVHLIVTSPNFAIQK